MEISPERFESSRVLLQALRKSNDVLPADVMVDLIGGDQPLAGDFFAQPVALLREFNMFYTFDACSPGDRHHRFVRCVDAHAQGGWPLGPIRYATCLAPRDVRVDVEPHLPRGVRVVQVYQIAAPMATSTGNRTLFVYAVSRE